MAFTTFTVLAQNIDGATASFVTEKAAGVISAITPVAIAGVAIYISIFGYMVMAGRIQEPFSDFLIKCCKIIIIAAFALNAGNYANWVVGSINSLRDGLSGVFGTDSNIYTNFDNLISLCWDKVQEARNKMDLAGKWFPDFAALISWALVAVIVMVTGIVLTCVTALMILVSDILLKITLAFGPLMIMCLFWPPTQKFFDSWFGQVLTYVFKIVVTAALFTIASRIFRGGVNVADFSEVSTALVSALQLAIMCFVLYRALLEVGGVASGLAGGVSAAAMSVGQAVAAALAPARAAAAVASPVTSTAARIASGQTMLAPGYRRASIERMKARWGSGGEGGSVKGLRRGSYLLDK
jgi:type IV secretion system protein VirB6